MPRRSNSSDEAESTSWNDSATPGRESYEKHSFHDLDSQEKDFHEMSLDDPYRQPQNSAISWLKHVIRSRDNHDYLPASSDGQYITRNPRGLLHNAKLAWLCCAILGGVVFFREFQRSAFTLHSVDFRNTTLTNSTLLLNTTTPEDEGNLLWPPDRRGDTPNTQNVAYLTMFTETVMEQEHKTAYSYNDDVYFIGLRMLTYQLLHAPETRTRRSIPFIIMVNDGVTQEKRDQLEKDGAIILPVDPITDGFDWINPGGKEVRWRDQLTKLHAWQLTQFDRILYVDGDMVLMRSLDGIFDSDQFNNTAVPTLKKANATHDDEAPMPENYLIASMPETWGGIMSTYSYPPKHQAFTMGTDYLNGGFLLFQPSEEMYEYYLSVARAKGRFNPIYMEQSLLNYAHRASGNMPSLILPTTWNNIKANREAVAGRVASIHDKWWEPRALYLDTQKFFMAIRWRMEAFYELRDNYRKSKWGRASIRELDGVSLDYTI